MHDEAFFNPPATHKKKRIKINADYNCTVHSSKKKRNDKQQLNGNVYTVQTKNKNKKSAARKKLSVSGETIENKSLFCSCVCVCTEKKVFSFSGKFGLLQSVSCNSCSTCELASFADVNGAPPGKETEYLFNWILLPFCLNCLKAHNAI